MDNDNEFNISSDNDFQKSKVKHANGGLGKNIVMPFVFGVLGASLVMGTCFGVPSIKEKLIGRNSPTSSITNSSNAPASYVNIADYSQTSVSVAEKVLPSVVGIKVTYQISSIFGNSSGEATGSGIIISDDGYIVTNNHVIASGSSSSFYAIEEASGITVSLYGDTQTYDAKVVGTDTVTDLAVIKIEKTGLTPAELGDSSSVRVGEFVMAVGNPVGMDYSVTSGIVSAVNREVVTDGTTYTAIQTDAAINSGNSGGALVNSNGQVIGINTLKLSGTGIEGIGFAIPISSTTDIIDQLITYSSVKRPYIGISGTAVGTETAQRYHLPEGVYVESVEKDSPAEKSGLKQGDIITKIEGNAVKSVNELNRYKNTHKIGDTIPLTIYRDNQESEIQVTLEETPESNEESSSNTQQQNAKPDQYNNGSIFDFFR